MICRTAVVGSDVHCAKVLGWLSQFTDLVLLVFFSALNLLKREFRPVPVVSFRDAVGQNDENENRIMKC